MEELRLGRVEVEVSPMNGVSESSVLTIPSVYLMRSSSAKRFMVWVKGLSWEVGFQWL